MTGEGFAKVVVRGDTHQVNAASRTVDAMFEASDVLLRRATTTLSATGTAAKTAAAAVAATESVSHRSGSGLSPIEIALTLAVLCGLFLTLLFVGAMCKIFNKPRKEAAPYVQQKLYQPSAAGYGTRAAMQKGTVKPSPGGQSGSRISLLAAAGPMGYDGRGGESSFDTSHETIMSAGSHGTGGDYFDRKQQTGHTRGQSSGVQLPGATMVSSRKGAGTGAHPTLDGVGIAPDGGGFTPGKPVTHTGYAGPMSSTPKGPGGAPANPIPAHARVGLGRPPAADANRRSRYSRATSRRIDSVGPGQIRKSLYLGADDDPMNSELYSQRRSRMVRKPSTEGRDEDGGGTLRRIDSMGRGDSRRKSQAVKSTQRASRAISVYNAKGGGGDKAILLSAQADNFGSGRNDPLGARSNNANAGAYLSPTSGPGYAPSLDARSRSGSGSSSSGARSGAALSSPIYSPGELPSPNGGPVPPQYGRPIPSRQGSSTYNSSSGAPTGGAYMPPFNGTPSSSPRQPGFGLSSSSPTPQYQQQQGPPPSQSPMGYPGGGAPRIRPGQPFQPYAQPHGQAPPAMQAVGGYDRAARQIV